MHLVGPYLTTTNYKKRKGKVTQAQMNRWMEGYREQCKLNKRIGMPKPTFEEYVDRLHGRIKQQPKPKKSTLTPRTDAVAERIKQHREMYPSLSDTAANPNACAKKEPLKYTGTLIKGIATMHKSNAVPIIDDTQAKEIARMRRG